MLTLSWRWVREAYKAQLFSALAPGGEKSRCRRDQKARQRAQWYELSMNCEGVDSPYTQKPPKITATEQPKSHIHATERTAQCRKTVHKLKYLSLKKHRHEYYFQVACSGTESTHRPYRSAISRGKELHHVEAALVFAPGQESKLRCKSFVSTSPECNFSPSTPFSPKPCRQPSSKKECHFSPRPLPDLKHFLPKACLPHEDQLPAPPFTADSLYTPWWVGWVFLSLPCQASSVISSPLRSAVPTTRCTPPVEHDIPSVWGMHSRSSSSPRVILSKWLFARYTPTSFSLQLAKFSKQLAIFSLFIYAAQKLSAQSSHLAQPWAFFLTHFKSEIKGLQQQPRIRRSLTACSFQILLNSWQMKY